MNLVRKECRGKEEDRENIAPTILENTVGSKNAPRSPLPGRGCSLLRRDAGRLFFLRVSFLRVSIPSRTKNSTLYTALSGGGDGERGYIKRELKTRSDLRFKRRPLGSGGAVCFAFFTSSRLPAQVLHFIVAHFELLCLFLLNESLGLKKNANYFRNFRYLSLSF